MILSNCGYSAYDIKKKKKKKKKKRERDRYEWKIQVTLISYPGLDSSDIDKLMVSTRFHWYRHFRRY